jgi:hypothetical protein
MNFLPCISQFGSIIAANGACADDSVSHNDSCFIKKCDGKGTLFFWNY